MSLSLILLPMAVAGVSAIQAARTPKQTVQVTTRMRNVDLLRQSLQDLGASTSVDGEQVRAQWPDVTASFVRDVQGIWSAHFVNGTSVESATARITDLDVAYGRRVQQLVLATLRERAADADMEIESEIVDDDESVTVVLNVQQQAV